MSTLISNEANDARCDVMKSFKFEQLKRKEMPEFLRKSRKQILDARKITEEDEFADLLGTRSTQNLINQNHEFSKFFEEKVTKNSSNLDEDEKESMSFNRLPKRKHNEVGQDSVE